MKSIPGPGRIQVQTHDDSIRKKNGNLLFDFFSAEPFDLQMMITAALAYCGRVCCVPAVMTFQLSKLLMICQCNGTIFTYGCPGAICAFKYRRETSPVLKKNYLFLCFQSISDGVN